MDSQEESADALNSSILIELETHSFKIEGSPLIMSNPTPPLVFNPNSPDVFADRCSGVSRNFDNIKLSFEALRYNHANPSETVRMSIGQLIMPMATAVEMAKLILEFSDKQTVFLASPETDTVQ